MPKTPHILLITDDQHRSDCLSVAGHPVIQTPHLDQLAYEGVRFDAAYSECPICIPARCTLISGRYATSYGRPRFFKEERFPVERGDTLMGRLAAASYQTQAVGKMHFHPHRARYGFDDMILDLDYIDWLERETPYRGAESFMGRGMGLNEFWPVPAPMPAGYTSTAWFTEQAIRFLHRRDPDQPFFLWLSYYKPHPPNDPPEPYYSMYDPAPIDSPTIGDWVHGDGCPPGVTSTRLATKADRIPPHVWRKIRSCYYGLITEIDHQLGRLFGAMRFLNLLDDTLILFTSDHGEMLGDHELMNKSVLYDAAARVPLIVRPPAAWKIPEPGRVARAPVTLADVLPTLVEAGGGELPNGIDGRSFLPLVKGESVAWRDCVPGNVGDQQFSLTDGRVKYIWHRWGDIEQLFDLKQDPREAHDLSGDAAWAERRAEWRRRLIAFLSEKGSPATDGERLLPIERPLPSERALRARNPFGYTDGRPWT